MPPLETILVANQPSTHQDGKVYNKWRSYGQSKTANVLYTVELAAKLGPKGIKSFSLHPGYIRTNLSRSLKLDDFASLSEYPNCHQALWIRFAEGGHRGDRSRDG